MPANSSAARVSLAHERLLVALPGLPILPVEASDHDLLPPDSISSSAPEVARR
jgi:hypothetical protein